MSTTTTAPARPGDRSDTLRLLGLIHGHWAAGVIGTLARLKIVDQLEGGPRGADELARAIRVEPSIMARLLRAAAFLGVLEQVRPGVFAATPVAADLRADGHGYRELAIALTEPGVWRAWERVPEAIATSDSTAAGKLGGTLWEHFEQHPAEAARFAAAMGSLSARHSESVLAAVDSSRFTRIVDVGGSQGVLLLGGRAGDLLGRRRVMIGGLAVFTGASLVCGLSSSAGMLIAARAVEGGGAAIISPAALAIVSTTFPDGAERNKAMGIFFAMGGLGPTVGVLAGGLLTSGPGWEWIFYINLPVGVLALLLAGRLLSESRAELGHRRFDLAGALLGTAGLSLLVYAVVSTNTHRWGSATTLGLLGAAAALLVAFLLVEARSHYALMPLAFFRNLTASGANAVGLMLGTSTFAMFFFLSLYMQQVLRYSATTAGLAFLVIAVRVVVFSGVGQAFVTRVGIKPVLTAGMAMIAASQLWFARVPVAGSYPADLLPGFVVLAAGLGLAFVAVGIAALTGVRERDAGLASGLINTSQQIGGAVGIAITSTVAAAHTSHLLNAGHTVAGALTSGFHVAFLVTAGFAAAGALIAMTAIRQTDMRAARATPAADTA